MTEDEHRAFFTELLGDVDEPTAPFGVLVSGADGRDEASQLVDTRLTARLCAHARTLGVTAAALCHVAWGQVLARSTGRDDVVFGTRLSDTTLPIRLCVGDVGTADSLRRTQALLEKLSNHGQVSLAFAERCSRVEAPAPLVTSLLHCRHEAKTPAHEPSSCPLRLAIDHLGERWEMTATTKAPLEARRVCAMMHASLEGLAEALETAPARPVRSIEALPESERSLVLREWNRTQADYPSTLCIHHLFEQQVTRTPDATAVECEREHVSYAELNVRANRLAHHLIAHGVGPDVRVAVCVQRSVEMVVGVLAVLKAGGAYVALDPEHPRERLRGMLADCAPAVVLAHLSLADRFGGVGVSVVDVDSDAVWANQPEVNPERHGLTPEHLVYVIYTSGSTGAPKGVMNEHRTLVNRVAWAQRAWELTAADVVLCLTPLTFDGSVREIFLPLSAGARVVLTRPGGHRDPAYLVATIQRHRITTVNLVPSLLQLLVNERGLQECTTVRQVLCGGESMTSALVERLRVRLPRVQLRHLYGPSEAATALTVIDCIGHAGDSAVPVGQPIANTRAYLLDRWGRPVPAGVAGELYIGGAGVGRGYVGRAALTAERFVPDPFSAEPGARQYRTGDLGRWLTGGQIEFLGRTDFQVKVRGQRVEPREVEACLRSHPHVREAVVIAREHAPGDQRLVAYYVASRHLTAETLRGHLSAQLPDYMVPAAYVPLERLPLTPHGKLDRKALPAPSEAAYARRDYDAPVDDTERALAAIWSEVLGLERVSRGDHFFDLGGHSLLAVQVISRVRQGLDVDVALSELFTRPVLADFADGVVDAQLAQFDPDEIAELAALLRSSTPVGAPVLS